MDYDKLFRLDGRVAVVIGAGSGIGQSAARGLAAHGALVVCADVQQEAAEKTATGTFGCATPLPVDVTRTESVAKMFHDIIDQHQRLDVVVTTPGANVRKPISAYQDSEFDRVIWLEKGRIRGDGPPKTVLAAYVAKARNRGAGRAESA